MKKVRNPDETPAEWPFRRTVKALEDVVIVDPALRRILAERKCRESAQ